MTDFGKLGLIDELVEVLGKIGVLSPSEIQCLGIPAILERKSVLLSSVSGHHRTLAYLLPLIQVTSLFYFFIFYGVLDYFLLVQAHFHYNGGGIRQK